MPFRLLSYNIHKGIGGIDRKYNLARIEAVLDRYQPDIALLQEVDDGVPRSRRQYQVELLANSSGLVHFAYQRNVTLKQGHYGNAILSRYPLHETLDIDLTVRFKKRRRALAARLTLDHGGHRRTVVVVNVHLGLAGVERRMQLRRLLTVDELRRVRRGTPMIIAGDYNDVWGRLGQGVLQQAGFLPAHGAIKTFPAAVPLRPLDRVFYRGHLEAVHAMAGRAEVARRASDHLPLVVDFNLTNDTA